MASCFVLPEGRIQDAHLKNLCALFDSVHIGLPWLMDPTPEMTRCSEMGVLQIHQPDRPIPQQCNLSALLKDYRNWAAINREQSLSSFVKAALMQGTEEARWEISRAIKQMNKEEPPEAQTRAITSFLLLHLYQQVLEDKAEAAEALASVDMNASFLAEALGDATDSAPSPAPTVDNDIGVPLNEDVITDVLEAWTFMFTSIARDVRIAVAPNPQVFDLIVNLFEETMNKNIVSARAIETVRVFIPSCENIPIDQFISAPVVDMKREAARTLSEILNNCSHGVLSRIDEENEKLKNELLSIGASDSQLYTLVVAPLPNSFEKEAERDSVPGFMSGKLVITIERA